jgi:hypothetical protein
LSLELLEVAQKRGAVEDFQGRSNLRQPKMPGLRRGVRRGYLQLRPLPG